MVPVRSGASPLHPTPLSAARLNQALYGIFENHKLSFVFGLQSVKIVMSFVKCLVVLLILYFAAFSVSASREKRYTNPAIAVALNQLPWIVQQNNYYGRWCTAFLISIRHAITSAHCLEDEKQVRNLKIELINLESKEEIKILRYVTHRNYKIASDIAIMELAESVMLKHPPVVDFSRYSCEEVVDYVENPFAAGYQESSVLKKVNLFWLLRRTCNHKASVYVLNYPGDGKGGDSGAPLFYVMNGTNYILGIHSSGFDHDWSPIYYTTIFHNMDFITNYIDFNGTTSLENYYNAVTIDSIDWKEPTKGLSLIEEGVIISLSSISFVSISAFLAFVGCKCLKQRHITSGSRWRLRRT